MRRESLLDNNHSHFILVDNGTTHNFGTEIEFRAIFEKAVSNMHDIIKDDAEHMGW